MQLPAKNKAEERIQVLQQEIEERQKELINLKKEACEGKAVEDYMLTSKEGIKIKLSELFGDSEELLMVHNMGKSCPYCTLWADEINGIAHHLYNRVPWVMESPDSPEVQKEFADSRAWNFKMVSTQGTSLKEDLGFEPKPESYWPGYSIFKKDEQGNITHYARDHFGPGDSYCGVWHFLELLPNGVNGWIPKYSYDGQAVKGACCN